MQTKTVYKKKISDSKIFFFIFFVSLTILVFSSDGHRFSFDEDTARSQAFRIVTQTPHPEYVQDESKLHFEHARFKTSANAPTCYNGVLCSTAKIGHSLTEVPFIWFNHQFNMITSENVEWTLEEFSDAHYVLWRNDANPDFIFLELMYGPTVIALTVAVFFLVCRSFSFSQQNSILLSFLFGFTTIMWAYSQTSLNSVPQTFFALLGFYFLRKSFLNNKIHNILFCGIVLGFAFLVRSDAVFFIAVFLGYLVYNLIENLRKNRNFYVFFKSISAYLIPTISAYYIERIITIVRFGQTTSESVGSAGSSFILNFFSGHSYPLYEGGFGLLLSPGVGLFVFSPILFLIFVSFFDFFKQHKNECILFLTVISLFLLFYGTIDTWHGLNSWGPRYLVSIVPFAILPLGASLEKRQTWSFRLPVIVLGSFGVLINLVYLIQDVSWFVWGWPGTSGLYGIDKLVDGVRHPLNIDPSIIWTFEYSQLTQSFLSALYNLQVDIFLLKVLGAIPYVALLASLLLTCLYFFFKIFKTTTNNLNYSENSLK